jgi:hypothetical protein
MLEGIGAAHACLVRGLVVDLRPYRPGTLDDTMALVWEFVQKETIDYGVMENDVR